jgi:hypothetical protein
MTRRRLLVTGTVLVLLVLVLLLVWRPIVAPPRIAEATDTSLPMQTRPGTTPSLASASVSGATPSPLPSLPSPTSTGALPATEQVPSATAGTPAAAATPSPRSSPTSPASPTPVRTGTPPAASPTVTGTLAPVPSATGTSVPTPTPTSSIVTPMTATPTPLPAATETPVPTAAAPATVTPTPVVSGLTVSVEPATVATQVDDFFTLDVVIANVGNLGAFEFDLTYDPAVMWVTDVQVGDFLGSTNRTAVPLGPEIDNDAGLMAFAAFTFGEPAGPDGGGRLATIICQARGAGMTAVTLANVQLADTQAAILTPLTTLDGSVTVQSP